MKRAALALALIAVACTAGSDTPADDTPQVAGMCAEGHPDCEDTIVVGDDEPAGGEPAAGSSSGLVVNNGLTIPEALATDAVGVLAVRGFLFIDEDETRLCEVLAESLPPQCGGDSIQLVGFDAGLEETQSAQGITWTDDFVIVFGEIIDGTLTLDPLVSG